jgi:hypothetical protein
MEFIIERFSKSPRRQWGFAIAAGVLFVISEGVAFVLAVLKWHEASLLIRTLIVGEHFATLIALVIIGQMLANISIRDQRLIRQLERMSLSEGCALHSSTEESYAAMVRSVKAAKREVRTTHLRWSAPTKSTASVSFQQCVAEWAKNSNHRLFRLVNIAGNPDEVRARIQHVLEHHGNSNYDYRGCRWLEQTAPFPNIVITDDSALFICAYCNVDNTSAETVIKCIQIHDREAILAFTDYFNLLFSRGVSKDQINQAYLLKV